MEQNNFFIPELEQSLTTPSAYVAQLNLPKQDQAEALEVFTQYQAISQALPIEGFLKVAKSLKFDPIAIAQQLNAPLSVICTRMGCLPRHDDIPRFGIMECDGSGAVTFRKQLSTLSLPRFGSACPLWPIYRSLSQPLQPIKAFINTPTGERFLTYSLTQYADQNHIGLPARTTAVMIFTPDYEMFMSKPEITMQPNLAVGLQCSVCPRDNCAARRAKYLLQ